MILSKNDFFFSKTSFAPRCRVFTLLVPKKKFCLVGLLKLCKTFLQSWQKLTIVVIFLDEVNMRYQIAILRIYDHSTTFGFIFLINGMINKQINHS